MAPPKGKENGHPVEGKGKSPQGEEGNGALCYGKDGWEELQLYLAAVGSNDEIRHKGRWAMIKAFLQDNGVEFLVHCSRQREKAALGAPIMKPGRCPMCQDTGFVLLHEEEEEVTAVVLKEEELDIPLDEEEGGVVAGGGAYAEGETSAVPDCASLEEGTPASNAGLIVRIKLDLDLPQDEEGEESLKWSGAEGEVALSCSEVRSTHPLASNEPEMRNQAVEGNTTSSAAAASERPAPPTGNDDLTLRSGKRRIPAEVAEAQSGTVRKVKKSKKVLELKVEDIIVNSPVRAHDCCLPVDVEKWEEILKGCDSKSAILLPEGSFSFPPNYSLRLKADFRRSCNLMISGKGPEATFLCLHYPANPNFYTHEHWGFRSHPTFLNLYSSLTLEKITVRYHDTGPENPLPRVVIYADNCRVKDVNFAGCTLRIQSKRNLVEHCNFSSVRNIKPLSMDDLFDTAVRLCGDWDGNGGGNIIRNISIQNMHSGVCKERYSRSPSSVPSLPEQIKNVSCRNAWRGVFLKDCCGDTVKNLTCEWDDDLNCSDNEASERPTAVHIHDSEGITLDGITCKGETVIFNAFTVTRSSGRSLLSRRNNVSNVKGAKGRYVNEVEDTEITHIQN